MLINNICPECQGRMEFWPPHDLSYPWKKCGCCGFMRKEGKKFMISMTELNPAGLPTSPEVEANLNNLLTIMNQVRTVYAIPMIVTSGLRDIAKQEAIYAQKNKLREAQFLTPLTVPLNSQHLHGNAVDIEDKDGKLKDWIMTQIPLMESLGLYFEDFGSTPGWVHWQTVPPASGKRFFIP